MSREGNAKPWKSYEEQLDLLIVRGLVVTDRSKALDYLQRIGYYRLSGYWYPFRERSGPFVFLNHQGRKPAKKQRKVVTLAQLGRPPGWGRSRMIPIFAPDATCCCALHGICFRR